MIKESIDNQNDNKIVDSEDILAEQVNHDEDVNDNIAVCFLLEHRLSALFILF